MREIKLRAWLKEDKKLCHVTQLHFIDKEICVEWKAFEEVGVAQEYELMQYTGLKDKNGKEIYEGDIVETQDQNNIIKFQHGCFMLIGLHEDEYERNYSRLYHYLEDATIPNIRESRFDGVSTVLQVIGNIYENPELLDK